MPSKRCGVVKLHAVVSLSKHMRHMILKPAEFSSIGPKVFAYCKSEQLLTALAAWHHETTYTGWTAPSLSKIHLRRLLKSIP